MTTMQGSGPRSDAETIALLCDRLTECEARRSEESRLANEALEAVREALAKARGDRDGLQLRVASLVDGKIASEDEMREAQRDAELERAARLKAEAERDAVREALKRAWGVLESMPLPADDSTALNWWVSNERAALAGQPPATCQTCGGAGAIYDDEPYGDTNVSVFKGFCENCQRGLDMRHGYETAESERAFAGQPPATAQQPQAAPDAMPCPFGHDHRNPAPRGGGTSCSCWCVWCEEHCERAPAEWCDDAPDNAAAVARAGAADAHWVQFKIVLHELHEAALGATFMHTASCELYCKDFEESPEGECTCGLDKDYARLRAALQWARETMAAPDPATGYETGPGGVCTQNAPDPRGGGGT